ncbi:MAG: hypothetical protein JW888_02090 [Pirellulales bacterium]|nr:hypothetical protein [Pirellulales bacterium]
MMYRTETLPRLSAYSLLAAILAAASTVMPAAEESVAPKPALCELRIDGDCLVGLELLDKEGRRTTCKRPGKVIYLPPGQYRVKKVTLEEGYETADDVDLAGPFFGASRGESSLNGFLSASSRNRWFILAPDKPSTLQVGAPLAQTVNVTREGTHLRLDYGDLFDDAGRRYYKRYGGRTYPAPRFAVYKDGQEIGSGSFEYG